MIEDEAIDCKGDSVLSTEVHALVGNASNGSLVIEDTKSELDGST